MAMRRDASLVAAARALAEALTDITAEADKAGRRQQQVGWGAGQVWRDRQQIEAALGEVALDAPRVERHPHPAHRPRRHRPLRAARRPTEPEHAQLKLRGLSPQSEVASPDGADGAVS